MPKFDSLTELYALEDRIDTLEEALRRIVEWCAAYPVEIFPEPDWVKVRALLEAGGITLGSVAASNMRHVLDGINVIAREAL